MQEVRQFCRSGRQFCRSGASGRKQRVLWAWHDLCISTILSILGAKSTKQVAGCGRKFAKTKGWHGGCRVVVASADQAKPSQADLGRLDRLEGRTMANGISEREAMLAELASLKAQNAVLMAQVDSDPNKVTVVEKIWKGKRMLEFRGPFTNGRKSMSLVGYKRITSPDIIKAVAAIEAKPLPFDAKTGPDGEVS